MRIAFVGTGYINKIHARAAQNCGAELVAVVNHKAESMATFAMGFRISTPGTLSTKLVRYSTQILHQMY